MTSPLPGDRATGQVTGTIIQGDRGLYLSPDKTAVDERDSTRVSTPVFLDNLDSVEVIAPAERWQAGDVVFAAEASELWVVVGCLEDDPLWLTVDLRTGATGRGGSPPPDAVLDRRDGKRVLPEPSYEDLNSWFADLDDLVRGDHPDWRRAIAVLDERRGVIRP